jgi:hypothetical protein
MNALAVLDHLRTLRVDLSVTPAGKLHVEAPAGTLTYGVHHLLTVHRDALIAALIAPPQPPLDWPPPEPPWFTGWMAKDDRRRRETMAAGLRRRELSRARSRRRRTS